jgi:hypothetical protein
MSRLVRILLAAFLLATVPACGGGAVDSRNKDLDRPKSPNEKPAEPLKK